MTVGELVNQAIEESGMSKTQFAKAVEINKSFILRVISGEKDLSKNLLDKILEIKQVSMGTKDDLKAKYYELKYGKEAFNDITYFINKVNLFEEECGLRESIFVRSELFDKVIFGGNYCYCTTSKTETYEVISYIAKRVVSKDNSIFYSNFSPAQSRLSLILFSIFYERDYSLNLDFSHIVNVNKESARCMIEAAFDAFRWSEACLNTNTVSSSELPEGLLFPYYIITDEAVLNFNEECSNMVVITDKSVVSFNIEKFNQIRRDYTPLLDEVMDEISPFNNGLLTKNVLKHTYDGSLCLMQFTDTDILEKVFRQDVDHRGFLIKGVRIYFQFIFGNRPRQYMTRKSLTDFAMDGDLKVVTDKYISKLPPELRKKVLTNLRENPDNIYLLDDEKWNIHKNLNIHFYNRNLMMTFFPSNPHSDLYAYILTYSFKNSSKLEMLCKNIAEFIDQSDMYLSQEYLKAKIDELIELCEE